MGVYEDYVAERENEGVKNWSGFFENLGRKAYDLMNAETSPEDRTAFGITPSQTVGDLISKTGKAGLAGGQAVVDIAQAIKPVNVIEKGLNAIGLEPEYGKTSFGQTSMPVGLKRTNPSVVSTAPLPSQTSGESLNEMSQKNQEVIKRGSNLLYNTGATPEEVEKAWSSSALPKATNTNMFPREESSLAKINQDELEKFNIELGKMIDYAKKHVGDKFGIDIDTFDPQREALGNTYRQLLGVRYTPQQYTHLYEKNLAEATGKKHDAMSLISGITTMFKNHMGTEQQRKDEFARRMAEKEKDRGIKAESNAEKEAGKRKEKSGEIKKALDAHYFQFTNPIDAEGKKGNVADTPANLDDDMRQEYYQAQEEAERLMNSEKMSSAQASRQALEKFESKRRAATKEIDSARNFLKLYQNNPERQEERVARLKGYGYSQQAINKALATLDKQPMAAQTGGQPTPTNKKTNYRIVSVQ